MGHQSEVAGPPEPLQVEAAGSHNLGQEEVERLEGEAAGLREQLVLARATAETQQRSVVLLRGEALTLNPQPSTPGG